MKDLYLEQGMNPQVAILYATVRDTFNRLVDLVYDVGLEELVYKGPSGDENSIGQLLRHLAIVDLYWVYRLKNEPLPSKLQETYGPMLDENRELPQVANYSLEQLMQNYQEVQSMFYKECMNLKEEDLQREVFYEKGETATIRWGIWHIADHNRYHQAHIGRLRKLYQYEKVR
ncbi:DinB family protein [Bacillus sp. DX1.1]|uniref:DinB family protein n=1 Tax=unclassified Bacillus (in: firmicutes) TaxID=185979 RepID=UPI00256FA8C2|nr:MULTISPECIES: DinB family protein [unclassified Bacillus (in: firmicutes)]MDM5155279.1 DinB family protein [Bacillus sp. DX1.1]WJE79599.1 DinB family protein [Bacillus sp. DX3.1]